MKPPPAKPEYEISPALAKALELLAKSREELNALLRELHSEALDAKL